MKPAFRHLLRTLVPLGLAGALGGSAALQAAPVVTALSKPAVGDRATRTVGFTRLDPAMTGLAFTNVVAESRYLTNQIYLNGSGVACGDVDGDGRPDVFLGGLSGGSALFRNLGGLHFTNITAAAFPGGEPARLDVTGCVFADLDGDGDLDLVLNTVGQGTWIFLNDGHGHLAPTQTLNPGRGGMSVAVADVDGDGDLDLYVANYRTVTVRDDPAANFQGNHDGGSARVTSYNGRPTSDPDLIGRFSYIGGAIRENGEPHVLLLNDGHGHFTPVSWTDGAFLDEDGKPLQAAPYDWGLSCMLRDFTGDGKPDLYVCNDFESPDRVWVNETQPGGPVRFRAMRPVAMRSTPAFSMGVDAGDINRDGHDDLIALDMLSRSHALRNVQVAGLPPNHSEPGIFNDRVQFSRNMLQLGRGDGTFAEVGRLTGLAASEWSWTPIFLDVDLDGWEDVLISNGNELGMMDTDIIDRVNGERMKRRISPRERIEMRRLFSRNNAPNAAFHNNRNLTFTDVSKEWGFDLAEVSLGMALVDLDGDGDADVVLNNLNGAAAILRNEATAPRISVRLKGSGPNTHGVGGRIRVTGGPVAQSQEIIAGGRYLSSDSAERTFATGTATTVRVDVTWRTGRTTVATGVAAGSNVELAESDAVDSPVTAAKETPLFVESAGLPQHIHHQEPFDDFARQPLLPRNLAMMGPGASWIDIDGDGRDDLVIGGGVGGSLAVFHNDGEGRFSAVESSSITRLLTRDLTTILPMGPVLVAGSANYQDGATNGGVLKVWDLAKNVSGESVKGQGITAGPLAMADVDGDGTLGIFVGGRTIVGRWPQPGPAVLLKAAGGRFTVLQRFETLGSIQGACFTDLDGDGKPELVVAGEWGPPRVFKKEGGTFQEKTAALGLDRFTGWWNSVAAGDFDGDGRMDLVLGNSGWNQFPGVTPGDTESRTPPTTPLRQVRFGDLMGDGIPAVIESYFSEPGRELPLRKADAAFAAFPQLRDRFPTRAAYGAATVTEIYGTALAALPVLEARWFATTVFLNRGDHFEARPLPVEAQFSPVYGIAVADFDGDGIEDLVLAQNHFATHRDDGRQDAGRGLLLRGDGTGGFRTVSAGASGIEIYGEGRAVAVADFNGDGRPDLVMTQNGGATRLLENRRGRPGLRVRLNGPPGNPAAIGSTLRWVKGDKKGPKRELHQGAGYWSCDSPTTVMSLPEGVSQLEIHWPGGTTTTSTLPPGVLEVRVALDGTVTRVR